MKTLYTFLAFALLSTSLLAQSPNKMSFQAVIRDANGALVTSSQVGIQISIVQGNAGGTPIYSEVHSVPTNSNGLLTLEIGTGNVTLGNFNTINWANGPYFLQTDTDPSGGFSYTISSTSQLMSVPYALYSKFADATNETDPVFNSSVASGISNTDITNWNNKLDTELDGDPNNELQAITISNDTIFLSNGGFIKLPAQTSGFNGQYSSLTGAPTNVSFFVNDAGYLTTEIDGDSTNELQSLSLSNDTLYLTNGGFVILPPGFDGQYSSLTGAPTNVSFFNNDAGYIAFEVDGSITNEIQAISISNDTLFLSSGGFAVLPTGFDGQYSSLTGAPTNISFFNNDTGYLTSFNEIDGDTTNEIQNLTISNDTLFLSNGGFAVLPSSTINLDNDSTNELQAISISNDTLFLSNGGYALLPTAIEIDGDTTNELQTLSISNDTLFLSSGGYAIIPSSSTEWSKSGNAGTLNGTSFIGTTDNQDVDFRTNDTIRMRLTNQGQLEFLNTGNSVFIGENAGANDDLTNNRNVFIGNNSGSVNSTGYQNTAIGAHALKDNTTGYWNTATGYGSLEDNSTGSNNIALGSYSLNANTTGNYNTSIGHASLYSNTTGHHNNANGFHSLHDNTTGSYNTTNGALSLYFNIFGNYNVAHGNRSLYKNTTGDKNTAMGNNSLYQNTTGNKNVAIGDSALFANTTVSNLTAVGSGALGRNTTGNENAALGYQSLKSNTTGYENTAVGHSSLLNNVSGYRNTATGFESLKSNTTGKWNTANGVYSMKNNTTGSNNTGFGYKSLFLNTTGEFNTALGGHALNDNTTGTKNTASGYDALEKNTTGNYNSAFGFEAIRVNTTGSENTALGYTSMRNNTTGFRNTATGFESLKNNTTGKWNSAIGAYSMKNNTTGFGNVSTGYLTLTTNTTGFYNTASGVQALMSNTTGDNNTAVGIFSLEDNTIGINNTAVGSNSLGQNTIGSNNTAVGRSAYSNSVALIFSNSSALGYSTSITASNQIRLGNVPVTSIGGTANWTNVSDARFKTDIKENIAGLDFIMKLRPVSYHLDMDAFAEFYQTPDSLRLPESEALKAAEIQTGFIAQEVEKAAQEVGFAFHGVDAPKNENDHYGLRYAEFVVPMVKAMQEQQEIIDEQQKTIELLMKRLEAVEAKIGQ